MATWLTSDQHFGHRNVIAYCKRPFADLDEMHRELVARHNAVVRDDDIVWHLGDFSLDDRMVRKFLPLLRGRHHLVPGNHDKCHPMHKRHEAAQRKYLRDGFRIVVERGVLPEQGFEMCHLPYAGDDGDHGPEARYPEWRPKDIGWWLLCGHVHEAWKARGRMLNVGVDQWGFAPVNLETLCELRDEIERERSLRR